MCDAIVASQTVHGFELTLVNKLGIKTGLNVGVLSRRAIIIMDKHIWNVLVQVIGGVILNLVYNVPVYTQPQAFFLCAAAGFQNKVGCGGRIIRITCKLCKRLEAVTGKGCWLVASFTSIPCWAKCGRPYRISE